jgi:murein DD-endopeptidase MepM/ murein hydrolase activator NlpD
MKKIISSLLLAIQFVMAGYAQQQLMPAGGEGKLPDYWSDAMSTELLNTSIVTAKQNINRLIQDGILPAKTPQDALAVAFAWPVKQANGYSDPGFYGISNFVDHNLNYPNLVSDFNCGNRTYDLSSGYNHKGLDIFSFPFAWTKMATNAVEVIAAASGTIIYKSDGNADNNCSFCTTSCDWNAVYIQHSDGSVAFYGHLKNGSITSKTVGQTVSTGEYLGVVGSSGNSTGPHLHFEVYANNSFTQLIDPYAGTCNTLNGTTSWWAAQPDYYQPRINKLMTHSVPPIPFGCPADEQVNANTIFGPSSTVKTAVYLSDQQPGTTLSMRLYQPGNILYANWSFNLTSYYSSSYWYWNWTLPANPSMGEWRFETTYNAQTVSHSFTVTFPTPVKLNYFNLQKKSGYAFLEWASGDEITLAAYTIERSTDAYRYETINTVKPFGQLLNNYTYADVLINAPILYYRLKMTDKDGFIAYSPVKRIQNEANEKITVLTNPAKEMLVLNVPPAFASATGMLYNSNGKQIKNIQFRAGSFQLSVTALPLGIYYIYIQKNGSSLQAIKFIKAG